MTLFPACEIDVLGIKGDSHMHELAFKATGANRFRFFGGTTKTLIPRNDPRGLHIQLKFNFIGWTLAPQHASRWPYLPTPPIPIVKAGAVFAA